MFELCFERDIYIASQIFIFIPLAANIISTKISFKTYLIKKSNIENYKNEKIILFYFYRNVRNYNNVKHK